MRRLRTISSRRLRALAGAVAALAISGGIAQAALGGDPAAPPPKPLAQALHDAADAPRVAGVRARVTFTNALIPGGSLPGGGVSPLAAGASGRVWIGGDGQARLELQSTRRRRADRDRRGLLPRLRRRLEAGLRGHAPGRADHSGDDHGDVSLADVRQRSRPPRAGVDPVRRAARHHRRPARATPCGSRPRTTAGCSAPPSWPGTPRAGSRCAPPCTRRATATRCSSSRRPTSPTATSPSSDLRVQAPAGTRVTEIDPPVESGGQAGRHARPRRRRGRRPAPVRARRARLAGRADAHRRAPDPAGRRAGRGQRLRQRARLGRSSSSARPATPTRSRAGCRRSTSTARRAPSSPRRSGRS